jgi:hypothetical protein
VRKLRQVTRGRFVPGGNEAFDAVVQPVRRQEQLIGDAARKVTNGLSRLKKRVNIFRRQPGGKFLQ